MGDKGKKDREKSRKQKNKTGYGLNSEHSGKKTAIRLQPPGSAPGQRQNGAVLIGSHFCPSWI